MPQTPTLGLVGARGLQMAQQAIRQIREDELRQALIARQQEQREFENALSLRKQGEVERGNLAGEGLDTRRVDQGDRGLGLSEKRLGLDVNQDTREQEAHGWRGVTFNKGQENLQKLEDLIPSLPEHVRPSAQLEQLGGIKIDPEQMATPEQAGQRAGARGRAAWQGGGQEVYEGQQAAQLKFNPPPRPPPPFIIQTGEGFQGVDRTTMTTTPIVDSSGKQVPLGPTSDMRNRQAARGNVQSVIDSVSELSERINTGQGVLAKAVGTAARGAAKLNLDDDVAEYEALVKTFTPLWARAVGHTGVLTEQDVQSARAILPAPGDSKSLRDRKLARLAKIMGAQTATGQEGQAVAPQSEATSGVQFDYVPGRGLVRRGGD